MKIFIASLCLLCISSSLVAQIGTTIVLNPPDMTRSSSMMKAFSERASGKTFDTTSIALQDLSDLLWAANGVNRPADGKRTAPSAMNYQDVDVYVCLHSGVYLYDAKKHALEFIASGDHRKEAAGRQENFATAPVFLLLISDISRFRSGADSGRVVLAAEDAGMVSQNISLFCASAGLSTRPRATMDEQQLRGALKLKSSQRLMLNHPVSYKKE